MKIVPIIFSWQLEDVSKKPRVFLKVFSSTGWLCPTGLDSIVDYNNKIHKGKKSHKNFQIRKCLKCFQKMFIRKCYSRIKTFPAWWLYYGEKSCDVMPVMGSYKKEFLWWDIFFWKEFIISNMSEVRIAQNHTFQKVNYLHKNLSLIP